MKFFGTVGFWEEDKEVKPGVYRPVIVEKPYMGDLQRNFRKFDTSSEKQNYDISVSNQVTILADLYMRNNLSSVRYVIWNGQKLSVKNVTIDYPRVTLEIGGVYSGPKNASGVA